MKARAAKQSAPAPQYGRGYFTALICKHRWPPRFEPQMQASSLPDWSAIATAKRALRLAMGDTGTILGLTRRSDDLIREHRAAQRGRA